MIDVTRTNPLAVVLTELGWKPEVVARRLNNFAALHGRSEQMHAKTPYKWLLGVRPRSPWSALAIALLTDVGDFAPYRRRPAVRQLTEQAAGLLKQ